MPVGWGIPPEWGLGALAASAFLSATLLPGGSELVLLWLARQGHWHSQTLLWTAAAANTLGALTTYGLGRLAAAGFSGTARSGIDARALGRLHRWGYPALLLSWVPVMGDALCLAAGWLRLRWPRVLGLLLLGKCARYGVLLWIAG
ncbi:MAG: YqaA family protein [Pseudomonadota bacterium]